MVPLTAADSPWHEATASVCTCRLLQSRRGLRMPACLPGTGTAGPFAMTPLLQAPPSLGLQEREADCRPEQCPHPTAPCEGPGKCCSVHQLPLFCVALPV